MSPEQIRGEAHFLDGRTDIWSFGVLLHELITGERPFQGQSWQQVFEQIEKRQPRPLRQFDERIPDRLQQLCLRCMEKEIAKRPSSAADVAQELRTVLADLSGQSPPVAIRRREVSSVLWRAVTAAAVSLAVIAAVWVGAGLMDSGIQEDKTPAPPAAIGAWPEVLAEGEWHNLLAYTPQPITWPTDPRAGFWQVDASSRELHLQCQGIGALAVGEVTAPNYTARITLHQPNWVGGLGLILGGQKLNRETQLAKSYSVVQIVERGQPSGEQYALDVLKISHSGNREDGRVDIDGWLSGPIPAPGPQDQVLEVRVRKGALHKIVLNEKTVFSMPQLRADGNAAKAAVTPGMLGVFCRNAAGTVRQVEVLVLSSLNDSE